MTEDCSSSRVLTDTTSNNHCYSNDGGSLSSIVSPSSIGSSSGFPMQKIHLRIQAVDLPPNRTAALGFIRPNQYPDSYAVVSKVVYNFNAVNDNASVDSDLPSLGTLHSGATDGTTQSESVTIIGQTEVLDNTKDPNWINGVDIEWDGLSQYHFHIHIFDKTNEQSFGTATFEISDILSTINNKQIRRLRSGGCVICHIESIVEEDDDNEYLQQSIQIKLSAVNLISPKTKTPNILQGKPDTYVEIAKMVPGTYSWKSFYRSNTVSKSSNPEWFINDIDLFTFCGGDWSQPVRILVYVITHKSKRLLLGYCETNLYHLLSISKQQQADQETKTTTSHLQHLYLQRNMWDIQTVGRMQVMNVKIKRSKIPTSDRQLSKDLSQNSLPELDMLSISTLDQPETVNPNLYRSYFERGGTIDFCVAVDFTSVNGNPNAKTSNHYIGGSSLNGYEESIIAVEGALMQFSQQEGRQYSVWGFGAEFGGVVRHLFQCGNSSTVMGVDGILDAYRSTLRSNLILSDPTSYDQVIQKAAVRSLQYHNDMTPSKMNYAILLIITACNISDIEETRRKLNVYSSLPLSIIFIGIGQNGKFDIMYDLCSNHHVDDESIRHTTSFLELHNYQYDPAALGNAVLKCIPQQIAEYINSRRF